MDIVPLYNDCMAKHLEMENKLLLDQIKIINIRATSENQYDVLFKTLENE